MFDRRLYRHDIAGSIAHAQREQSRIISFAAERKNRNWTARNKK
jgi:hypothetical protein